MCYVHSDFCHLGPTGKWPIIIVKIVVSKGIYKLFGKTHGLAGRALLHVLIIIGYS